jgi:hypothetical protein
MMLPYFPEKKGDEQANRGNPEKREKSSHERKKEQWRGQRRDGRIEDWGLRIEDGSAAPGQPPGLGIVD